MPLSGNLYKVAKVDAASSGANTIVAGVAGQTVRVYGIYVTLAAGTLIIKDGTTALTGAMTLTGLALDPPPNDAPLFVTAAGNAFVFTLSGTNQCSGIVLYTQD